MPSREEFAAMAQIRTAEETVRKAEIADWRKAEKRKQWKGRMKKVMAATALLATVKTGGFMDMAADPFHDAGATAKSAIEITPVTIPDDMDGIAFEDYSPKVQAEYMADETARVERSTEVENTIVSLFERADSDGYREILAEVAAEKQANPELYASEESATAAKEAIGEAPTNDAALEALGTFMGEYGITAGYGEDVKFEDNQSGVKKALTAYVDVFAPLPKDFIALAKLKAVTVSDKAQISQDSHFGTEAGSYSANDGIINIVTHGALVRTALKIEGLTTGDDYRYQTVVAHELGHAMSEQLPIGSHLDEGDMVDMTDKTDAGAYFGQIAKNHIDRPSHMSLYGRTSSDENTAEVLSGLLSDSTNGLATTDETRRFGSGANKSMIDMLAQLEEQRPGIAKILIANRLS